MISRWRRGLRRRINAFDGVVLAGAAVNVLVVIVLVVHWAMGT